MTLFSHAAAVQRIALIARQPEEARDGNILVQALPMDPFTGPDEAPVGQVVVGGVAQGGEPSQRDAQLAPILQIDAHAAIFERDAARQRAKAGKEVILATQRALEQQALERWRMQKEAQIEQIVRDGLPLGAVAASLASPETAERLALIEAATSGALSPLDAARLSLRRL